MSAAFRFNDISAKVREETEEGSCSTSDLPLRPPLLLSFSSLHGCSPVLHPFLVTAANRDFLWIAIGVDRFYIQDLEAVYVTTGWVTAGYNRL